MLNPQASDTTIELARGSAERRLTTESWRAHVGRARLCRGNHECPTRGHPNREDGEGPHEHGLSSKLSCVPQPNARGPSLALGM